MSSPVTEQQHEAYRLQGSMTTPPNRVHTSQKVGRFSSSASQIIQAHDIATSCISPLRSILDLSTKWLHSRFASHPLFCLSTKRLRFMLEWEGIDRKGVLGCLFYLEWLMLPNGVFKILKEFR